MTRHWVVQREGKVLTTNAERKLHHMTRAAVMREWREAFTWLARAQRVPHLERARIVVQPFQKRGKLQDTAACHPVAKAAVDGLVDAGVFDDDDGDHVTEITFMPCERGKDGLLIQIISLDP